MFLTAIFSSPDARPLDSALLKSAAATMTPRAGGQIHCHDLGALQICWVQAEYEKMLESPFAEDEEYAVFLDGEIYDASTLRASGDERGIARRVLASLHTSVADTCNNLAGDINLIFYEKQTATLHVASDFFGCKQLFVYRRRDRLVLSTELKPVLSLFPNELEVDRRAVGDLFNYSHVMSNRSIFRDVSRFPRNSVMKADLGPDGLRVATEHSDYHYAPVRMLPDEQYADELHEIMTEVFGAHAGLKGRKCIFLSGGLDSRVIAGHLNHSDLDFGCVTYGQSSSWDVKYAREVATLFQAPWTFINFKASHYLSGFQAGLTRTEGMLNGFHFLVCGFLGEIGQKYDVAYDGMLMDWYSDRVSTGRIHTMEWQQDGGSDDTTAFVDTLLTRFSPYDERLFNPDFLSEMRENHKLLHEQYKKPTTLRTDQLYMEFILENRVRRLLAVNSHGLRGDYLLVRFPYASHRLFDFFMAVDPKLNDNKRLFRYYVSKHFPKLSAIRCQANNKPVMEGWDEPTRKRLWHKVLLRHYIRRATHGRVDLKDPKHVTRYEHWLRRDKPLREFFMDILHGQTCRESNLFKKDGPATLLKLHDRGHQLFEPLCGVVTYVSFLDRLRSGKL